MSKPDKVQNYSEVCIEIMKVLSKYKITYMGFNSIMETIRKEIDVYTFIDICDDYKDL